jgi:hypothetical protein
LQVYYDVIARAHLSIGDTRRAQKYATLAEQTWIQYGGMDHDGLEDIRSLWEEVKNNFEEGMAQNIPL